MLTVTNPKYLKDIAPEFAAAPFGHESLMESLGYTYTEIIGGGGQGLVLKYRHLQKDAFVAVKLFPNKIIFAQESKVYQMIQERYPQLQSFVVKLLDIRTYEKPEIKDIVGDTVAAILSVSTGIIELDGGLIIMEFLSDGDLSESDYFIRVLKNPEWLAQWYAFIRGAKAACLSAHLMHADLQFRNIFIEIQSPHKIVFKLGDFGHSRFPSSIEYNEQYDIWIAQEWDDIMNRTKAIHDTIH